MEDKASMRRPHGTGTLYVQARANGREDCTGEGLNRAQAEGGAS
jgi:hypothetical protein